MVQPAVALRAGRDYPGGYAEFRAWFSTDGACADYLEWLRWPDGFVCPRCGVVEEGYRLADGRWWCDACRRRTSVTAGTVFHHTKTPLTVWFTAGWQMMTAKTGVSAKTLHRLLGFGSYETAWTMLHRYRHAISSRGLDQLSGEVEVDESFFGGKRKAGRPGRSLASGKYEVLLAVERLAGKGFGRARALYIPAETDAVIAGFLSANIVAGSTVHTDGAASYRRLMTDTAGSLHGVYQHDRSIIAGSDQQAHQLLPAVHRVAALAKRWLSGTHQQAVEADHLQRYLDEFCFRFNRRRSRSRGLLFYRLLELAIAASPRTYDQLVSGNARPKRRRPKPPVRPRAHPSSLAAPNPGRPWRSRS